MADMAEECLDILNNGHFQFAEPGPLRQPIRGFSLRRNDKLTLILETSIDSERNFDSGGTSSRNGPPQYGAGETAQRGWCRSRVGRRHPLFGQNGRRRSLRRASRKAPKFISLPYRPVTLRRQPTPSTGLKTCPPARLSGQILSRQPRTRRRPVLIGMADGGLTISSESEQFSSAQTAAKLVISGVTFYVCALDRDGWQAG